VSYQLIVQKAAAASAFQGATADAYVCCLHGLLRRCAFCPQNLQVKRLSARRFNTTYCYDFPSVFENALRSTWAARAAAGEPQSVPPQGRLVEAHELVLAGEADKDFTSNTLRLKRVERGPGNNDVGMVAWHMTLKTPECQQGRQVIAVANDITHKSGSFGPTEDALFRAAGELALEQRLPLVYLAANSGARVGLAEEVGVAQGQLVWLGPAGARVSRLLQNIARIMLCWC
jgi:acetyl-CoA carboxylase/biotin carboxylase 1